MDTSTQVVVFTTVIHPEQSSIQKISLIRIKENHVIWSSTHIILKINHLILYSIHSVKWEWLLMDLLIVRRLLVCPFPPSQWISFSLFSFSDSLRWYNRFISNNRNILWRRSGFSCETVHYSLSHLLSLQAPTIQHPIKFSSSRGMIRHRGKGGKFKLKWYLTKRGFSSLLALSDYFV